MISVETEFGRCRLSWCGVLFCFVFFSRLCWWPTVVAETCQVVVCDCTRDPSFRSIARPPGRYLFRSGSCGHLPHGVCPHATLMTTSTPKTQWTVANTVAFGRCCKSTRSRILLRSRDSSLPRVWSERRNTSRHHETFQAPMRKSAAVKLQCYCIY